MSVKTIVMLLAGGEGRRLFPLTMDRTKPAVPWGGRYRIIDIVLSNFVNSGFTRINVLTQFKADSLIKHISRGWQLESKFGRYIDIIPAQMRVSRDWYKGSADAIYQNLNIINDESPEHVFVFGADHIYKMEISQFLNYHRRKRADLTISALPVPIEEAKRFGVIEVDKDMRVIGFEEKPENPKPMPGNPDFALVSMGNYIFKADVLVDVVKRDAEKENSEHDFGKNVIPSMYNDYKVFVYDFRKNRVPGITKKEIGYWVDIGTIDSYWKASMDLVSVSPIFNLYNKKWPIYSYNQDAPPAKFVFANEKKKRVGVATDSIIAEGCIISGGRVNKSILFSNVRINSYSNVDNCILFNNVNVGRHCKLKNVLCDKDVNIPPHTVIGYNLEEDKKRFKVTEEGIVVIPKGYKFD
ncbi:glucose-1-phosphate adenylyltransferase [Thermotomaculum hydrothermale]|uniref:Glucose-1-phosphate adenylyltransferase n=1 Tax=Thermotomaculum hydrothermale TaxID=981385 RepID=A0A7R6SZ00_9BACT|nr:glucose-1-phosphate adenylyltransferase [Thermotomaculum hydrothermale]BBB33329.1 glucose-1-phosphate adenylyltransferase [Thermotomaculum hydrothermale]